MKKPSYLTVTRPELLANGSDDAFRSLIHDIIAYSCRIEETRNRLGALIGLTGTLYTVLISIAHLEGEEGVGISAIAEHLHLSGTFVTGETNKLIAQGLVNKRSDKEDRRRVRLSVTEEAKKRLKRLSKIQAPVNDLLFATINRSDFQQLGRLMSRLVRNSDEALALLGFYMTRDGTTG